MATTYAIYASLLAAGLLLGLILGLVVGWLWHRADTARLAGLLHAERSRYKRLRQNAEARLQELRDRLRDKS